MSAGAAVRIRRAGSTDASRLARLGRHSYREHYESLWEPCRLARWLDAEFARDKLARELRGRRVRYLIAWRGARAVGFCKTIADSTMPDSRRRGLELQKLYLLRAHTGQGIGSALLRRVLATADRGGVARVWLGVLTRNRAAAALYRRFGFMACAVRTVDTGRQRLRMQLMQRRTQSATKRRASNSSSARVARSRPSAISSSAR